MLIFSVQQSDSDIHIYVLILIFILLLHIWLCWVLVTACRIFHLQRMDCIVVVHGLRCPKVCGILTP